jgi:hypothetical protein
MKTKSALTVLLLFVPMEAAMGQEWIAGWEGGPSNGYGFVMPVFSLPNEGTHSFVIRPSGGYLYYNFREAGGFTNVSSPGAAIGVAYRLRTKKATFTIGPGFEIRWEHRDSANGSKINNNLRGATGQGDVYYQATALTSLSLNGSYEESNHYVWSRAGAKRQITNRDFKRSSALSLGAEVTRQGNHDVHQFQAGVLFEVGLTHAHGSLQFRSGYARLEFADGSGETRPYFGVGLYKAF